MEPVIRDLTNKKGKVFITFPYPYQNGTLHLGHAYSMSRAIFFAEYCRLKGYNVLFPFAFHATGMPIVACAAKLKDELEQCDINNMNISEMEHDKQIKILIEMGVPKEELYKFVDPEYWPIYFPMIAKQDLKAFNANVDFSRSFITTKMNPYYDSFVTWQFTKLINKGLVKKGKRYVVYSIKDGQACADHDRSSGEGVEPHKFDTKIIKLKNGKNLVVTYNKKDDKKDDKKDKNDKKEKTKQESENTVYYDSGSKYVTFKYKGEEYIVRDYAVKNFKYQCDNFEEVVQTDDDFDPSKLNDLIAETDEYKHNSIVFRASNREVKATGFVTNSEIGTEWRQYYEPNGEAKSRSGDICIVALIDQWFINYGDEGLKKIVDEYIKTKLVADKGVINQLVESSAWINEWPCSRSYGLGTFLPGTTQLIDSLSDSTIYMAYYTVAHLLHRVPPKIMTYDVWEYIFMDGSEELVCDEYKEVINEMREEFKYWYPVDLRVSGKDLVPNHLTMCLYNHAAIWGTKYMPKSYSIGGYITLNGKKMSKGAGNFMTLNNAVTKYGSDIVKISLTEKEGLDDADFRDSVATSYTHKLSVEKEFIKQMIDICADANKNVDTNTKTTLWEELFNHEMDSIIVKTGEHYENYKFRSAVYDGFHAALLSRDRYIRICSGSEFTPKIPVSAKLAQKFVEYILLMIYPVCPEWVKTNWEYASSKNVILSHNWPENLDKIISENVVGYNRCKYYKSIIELVANKINGEFDKNSKLHFNVSCITEYSEIENALIAEVCKHVGQCGFDKKKYQSFLSEVMKKYAENDKTMVTNVGRFVSYIRSNIETYGIEWNDFIREKHIDHFTQWLRIFLIPQCKNVNIKELGYKKEHTFTISIGIPYVESFE
ncbi:MAG: leucyl-tRNA synthetase [Terrestrivirus sp.]|uniref:leucine--tRNA ligase n=1 Tax=Terrestrivirus sp. TaxID=2487775 RepID=A0A3G4ZPS7_9VIRU|nr:MAG: leucyl-tRNA synthetase [Terrestrivirus sp.]